MKKLDPRFTLIAIITIGILIIVLLFTRKFHPPGNPAQTPTAQKAAQSIRDIRDW